MRKIIMLITIWATLNASAYCDRGVTASGEMVRDGICAMDKLNGQWVKFGTKVHLPDGRTLVVTDRFGGGYNNRLDIFMETEAECWQFGRRMLECRVEIP